MQISSLTAAPSTIRSRSCVQMRSMLRLPAALYAALNATLVAYAHDPQRAVILEWLGQFSAPTFELLGH